MRSLVTWAVRNTPSMNVVMVAALAVGIAATTMLRRERFPEHRPDEIEVRAVSYTHLTLPTTPYV